MSEYMEREEETETRRRAAKMVHKKNIEWYARKGIAGILDRKTSGHVAGKRGAPSVLLSSCSEQRFFYPLLAGDSQEVSLEVNPIHVDKNFCVVFVSNFTS
ncbi:hypothetical protein L6164_019840 [Bauhinia variegata]|uniref:Uncharacterized protein n=1 Tax=Bauhinia variegata TaxID=167791 RepID=A0ACB9MV61_BAUVA|nr:hypothetical protein L6164_019840 [Bauhinia variegata]